MDSKKIIEKLVKIAHNQQKIIHKLAQALPPDSVPTSSSAYTPGAPPSPAPAPTPGAAVPGAAPTHTEAKAIINSLPADVKNQLVTLEVHNGQVVVKWKAPVQDATFNAVTKTVQNLQQQNVLPGTNYKVVEKT
jgi:hypothetical protein